MNRYINADKLIELIDSKLEDLGTSGSVWVGRSVLLELKNDITSLQQEQPEVDLEKEMDKYYGMYRDKTGKTYDIENDEPCFDWEEDELSEHEMRLARHFYELGLKARKEE